MINEVAKEEDYLKNMDFGRKVEQNWGRRRG